MIKEFKEFALRGNVVDMAVGVIVGGAFGKIVTSLVNDLIMPPLGLVIGNVNFNDLAVTLKSSGADGKPVALNYGLFINNVVNFLIISFCIFAVVRAFHSFQQQAPVAPTEKKCPQCLMAIPIEAKKCGHCTSALA